MALVVTPGADNADSYVDLSEIAEYAAAHGKSFAASPATPAEAAARVATQYIDMAYRSRFPGARASGRSQALEWPRAGAEDLAGNAIASDEIPQEIIDAACEAAIRELAKPGSLAPDQKRKVRSVKAGSVGVEFDPTAPASVTFTAIDGILEGLLTAGSMGGIVFGSSVRA